MKIDLDNAWTPTYYGDEEDFVDDEQGIGKCWVLFSTKDGKLLLKRGPRGESYPISGHYTVKIGANTYKGKLLSHLIEKVRRKVRL